MSNNSLRGDSRAGFTWFPGDWLADEGVRSVSFAAKGLWMGMLCLMARSPRRGMLLTQTGEVADAKWVANQLGGEAKTVSLLLDELAKAGVFSRSPQGVIYNRKMRREVALSEKRAEAGRQGGLARSKQTQANDSSGGKGTEGIGKDRKGTAEERRCKQATELVALYWKAISHDGSKSRAVTNCTKLLKTVSFENLQIAVERLGADVKKHSDGYEYRASNFFGRKAYYKDFIGDAYEPRQPAAGDKPKARGNEHYENF